MLFQLTFPTRGSNLSLLLCRLSHLGSPQGRHVYLHFFELVFGDQEGEKMTLSVSGRVELKSKSSDCDLWLPSKNDIEVIYFLLFLMIYLYEYGNYCKLF